MTEWMLNRVINITGSDIKQITIIIILFYISICRTFNKHGMIYIGDWISGIKLVYPDLKVGQHGFLSRNCSFVNCFYITERFYFNDQKNFDVLLFNAKGFCGGAIDSPPNRSENQKFVFVGLDAAPSCPVYETKINFDLTWTYKLSSDIIRPFFIIKNKDNEVIGPRKYMSWDTKVEDMESADTQILLKTKDKNIAAFFMYSYCETKTPQQEFIEKLGTELAKYGQHLDTYGTCGQLQCAMKYETGSRVPRCSDLIQRDYYFYLAFEDDLGEDYVTDNLLHALNNYAVPVVYGGANYSRFMPDGIYLNARLLGVVRLAKKMMSIIKSKMTKYYEFFTWHHYYSYHETNVDNRRYDGICDLCALANNNTRKPLDSLSKFWNSVSTPNYGNN